MWVLSLVAGIWEFSVAYLSHQSIISLPILSLALYASVDVHWMTSVQDLHHVTRNLNRNSAQAGKAEP